MAAAAQLNASGFTTLMVERYDRVGGRASTIDVDGFRVNTGALIIELGGENANLFEDLGLTINARTPKRPLVLRLGRWDVPMMSGLTGLIFRALLALVGAVARRAATPDRLRRYGCAATPTCPVVTPNIFGHSRIRAP
jgi:phytoene dehydrogenase-like protein